MNGNTAPATQTIQEIETEDEKERTFRNQASIFTQALQRVMFKRANEVEDVNKKKQILDCQVKVSDEILNLIGA